MHATRDQVLSSSVNCHGPLFVSCSQTHPLNSETCLTLPKPSLSLTLSLSPMASSIPHPCDYELDFGNPEMMKAREVEAVEMPNMEHSQHRHVVLEASTPPPAAASDFQTGQSKEEDGVFLTWEDLWVTVSDGKKATRSILQGLTGYAKPGQTLAIMGPSGCGKSTLLDTLAGRLDSNTRHTGNILINGRRQTLSYGTSAYVTQDDILLATLTVREVIHYSAQLQLPESMQKSEKKERAEKTIRDMGLQDVINTRIGGGWGAKGLSGGQKRRVSICMEILTQPKLLFLDEPTSGLDSAASYYVMSRIVGLVGNDGRTIITSIHQPSSEVFQLFHNLCLLSSGRTVYFGPTSEADLFFARNGFPCPTLQNPSDHFLNTINKDFDEDIEEGFNRRKPTDEAINILVESYKSSENYQEVLKLVTQICKRDGRTLEKRRHASFLTQCIVLSKRSFINMYRDVGYYWLRLVIYATIALALGTIFYDIGKSYGSIQARGSLLMFVATFLTFMAIGGFPCFVEDMKVFQRERLNGHYGTSAFLIGNTISSTPFLLLVSIIPGVITYYLAGLHKGCGHISYFILVLFACMMLVESLMMIVASVVPNFLMGIIVGAGLQGLLVLGGGFFRLPSDLPKPFWKYPLYYIAFHKYAYQGMFKNEFEGLTFPNNKVERGATINGDDILRDIWKVETGYSKWVDLAILFGMVILFRIVFLVIIKTNEKVKPLLKAFMSAPSKHSTQVMVDSFAASPEGGNM